MNSFLYIDDENNDTIQAFIDSVKEDAICDIDLIQPNAFEKTAVFIIESFESGNYQGLILDWMLNDAPVGETGIPVRYKAAELAQFIRREIVERKCRVDFPIFIWSLEDRLMTSFYKDDTSHDLFDKVYLKSSSEANEITIDSSPSVVRDEINSFANVYRLVHELFNSQIKSSDVINKALNSGDHSVDKRILFNFRGTPSETNVHSHVHFLYREVINKPGVLISEKLLATRLGIDIERSKDWILLLAHLDVYKYIGVFSEIADRWWMEGIIRWWREASKQNRPLSSFSATKRVAILQEVYNLPNLIPSVPIPGLSNDVFWYLCSGYDLPLDFNDALLINEPNTFPWQDKGYISVAAIKNRVGFPHKVAVHPLELDRVQEILAE